MFGSCPKGNLRYRNNIPYINIVNKVITYYLKIKSIAIKYSSKVFRVYIYFINPKGEDITFYRISNIVFIDYKETR